MNKGVIYILTNPSFPQYVKIGYATDVRKRLDELNRSTAVPFAFRVYATYEVDSALSDKKLHSILDRLNPELRSTEEIDGKRRIRDDDDGHQILKHRARGSVPILYAGKIRILHRQHAHESESDQFLRVPPVAPNGKDILPIEKQVQEQEQAPCDQQPGDDQPFRSEAAVLQQILPGDAAAAPHGGAHDGHQQPFVSLCQSVAPLSFPSIQTIPRAIRASASRK